MNKTQIRLPMMLSAALALGVLIGSEFINRFKYGEGTAGNIQKFRDVLNYVDRYYVDTVDLDRLTETAISAMLKELDPHTSYVSAEDYQHSFAQLEGGFDGIGIEFNVFRDTIKVLAVTEGGPSEKAGLQSGDRIVSIDGTNVAGVGITSRKIVNMLRGKKGTEVNLKLFRLAENEMIETTVVRDKISSESIPLSYIISEEEKIGYIQINRFARYTHRDFEASVRALKGKGMESLVLDLRNNTGGYLSQAVAIADEFLAGKKEIVYTLGKEKKFNQEEVANQKGLFEQGALVVLLNENSASASELLAGALQDYDRGLIAGRRSFGKGLVQLPITLSDESMLRLTISRYYTPSGRSIQKSYADGVDAYREEVGKRYRSGEIFHADSFSLENDVNTFYTASGRTVYGGGGIMPDYFIPMDTVKNFNPLYQKIAEYDILRDFAQQIATDVRASLESNNQFTSLKFTCCFELNESLIEQLKLTLLKNDIISSTNEYASIAEFVENRTVAYLGRILFNDTVYYAIIHQQDDELQSALHLVQEAEALEKLK